jgi:hypothetical protein
LAGLTLLLLSAEVKAQANPYDVKAAFLYNFSHFVSWPEQAFSASNAPFVIGVLGPDPFGNYLTELIRGEHSNGHPIIVQRYKEAKDIRTCHVLFINTTDAVEVAKGLSGRNILTVSDTPNFARNGGMICLVTENKKIKLQINQGAAKAAGLEISSKLLRVADIVDR